MPSAHSVYCFTHYPVTQGTATGYYEWLAKGTFCALGYQDSIQFIKRLLQHLPQQQQQLCHWYFIEDYSYSEIARFTGLHPTTVKNHIASSMIILRNYMVKPKAPV